MEGILFALRKGVTKIIVEGDSKLVIQAVLGKSDTMEFNAYY